MKRYFSKMGVLVALFGFSTHGSLGADIEMRTDSIVSLLWGHKQVPSEQIEATLKSMEHPRALKEQPYSNENISQLLEESKKILIQEAQYRKESPQYIENLEKFIREVSSLSDKHSGNAVEKFILSVIEKHN